MRGVENGGHQASNAEHRGEAVGSQKNQRMMEGVITHQKGGCLIGGEERERWIKTHKNSFPKAQEEQETIAAGLTSEEVQFKVSGRIGGEWEWEGGGSLRQARFTVWRERERYREQPVVSRSGLLESIVSFRVA